MATHRIHHRHAEVPDIDPHTPRDGKWWSHAGWVFKGRAQQYPEHVLRRFAPDLYKDRFHVLLNRFYYVPLVALGLVLLYAGGWPLVLWGVCLRVTLALHATWLVNSAAHLWGRRRFATVDNSRNNWWIAALTFGEGWHNNHHAHPSSARHGLAWYEVDFNWLGIRLLRFLGLATAVKYASTRAASAER